MITKDLARRFCAALNAAHYGAVISVMTDGRIQTGEAPEGGAWMSMAKTATDGKIGQSTESSYDFLLHQWRRTIEDRNAKCMVIWQWKVYRDGGASLQRQTGDVRVDVLSVPFIREDDAAFILTAIKRFQAAIDSGEVTFPPAP